MIQITLSLLQRKFHRSLEEERLESDRNLESIVTGDLVTYQVGDLTLELTYIYSGDSAAFIPPYNPEIEVSGDLELDDKYVKVT